jgi:hypothetical protein
MGSGDLFVSQMGPKRNTDIGEGHQEETQMCQYSTLLLAQVYAITAYRIDNVNEDKNRNIYALLYNHGAPQALDTFHIN